MRKVHTPSCRSSIIMLLLSSLDNLSLGNMFLIIGVCIQLGVVRFIGMSYWCATLCGVIGRFVTAKPLSNRHAFDKFFFFFFLSFTAGLIYT